MAAEGPSVAPARVAGSGRPFRASWSLAAGWCGTPRLGVGVVVAVVVVVLTADSRLLPFQLRSWLRDGGPWLLSVAFVAWTALSRLIRTIRRRRGERRRQRRGGAAWWRDRQWSVDCVDRRVLSGMQGPSVWI